MASPSQPALSASSLKTPERPLVLSFTQSQEWLEKKCNLASFTMSDSQLKASAQPGLSEANQMGVSHLLEQDGPSCMTFREVSAIDVLPCGSGEGCYIFSHEDHLGAGLGEVAVDGCSPARGALVGGAGGGDRGDHPSKMW